MGRWPVKPGMLTVKFPELYIVSPFLITVKPAWGSALFIGLAESTIAYFDVQNETYTIEITCNGCTIQNWTVTCAPDAEVVLSEITLPHSIPGGELEGLRLHAWRTIERSKLVDKLKTLPNTCQPVWAGKKIVVR